MRLSYRGLAIHLGIVVAFRGFTYKDESGAARLGSVLLCRSVYLTKANSQACVPRLPSVHHS